MARVARRRPQPRTTPRCSPTTTARRSRSPRPPGSTRRPCASPRAAHSPRARSARSRSTPAPRPTSSRSRRSRSTRAGDPERPTLQLLAAYAGGDQRIDAAELLEAAVEGFIAQGDLAMRPRHPSLLGATSSTAVTSQGSEARTRRALDLAREAPPSPRLPRAASIWRSGASPRSSRTRRRGLELAPRGARSRRADRRRATRAAASTPSGWPASHSGDPEGSTTSSRAVGAGPRAVESFRASSSAEQPRRHACGRSAGSPRAAARSTRSAPSPNATASARALAGTMPSRSTTATFRRPRRVARGRRTVPRRPPRRRELSAARCWRPGRTTFSHAVRSRGARRRREGVAGLRETGRRPDRERDLPSCPAALRAARPARGGGGAARGGPRGDREELVRPAALPRRARPRRRVPRADRRTAGTRLARGRPRGGLRRAPRASEIYGQIGARFPEAWAALLAAERGDTSRLDAALAYFEEQRATPYVQRCRALLQASA